MAVPSLHDTLESEQEINTTPQTNDEHFDPFAIGDNNKKFGEITNNNDELNENVEDVEITIYNNDEPNDEPNDGLNENVEDEEITNNNNDEANENGDDDEDDDDDEDEEDEDLRREMEESWKKQEKDKNKNMSNLLERIRNKHGKTQTTKHYKSPNKNYPKIKPFVFESITFAANTNNKNNNNQNMNKSDDKKHSHPMHLVNNRKKMRTKLKSQLSKKRKKEIKKHRKQFVCQKMETEMEESEEDKEEKKELEQASQEEFEIVSSNDDDDDYEDEQEELARSALAGGGESDQTKISSELRELIDIAADEEDENGVIVATKFNDEHEEKFGIVKDLLCDKSEIKKLSKYRNLYDEKRNKIYQSLVNNEDDRDLELMKRAFIDGEYEQLQNKNRNEITLLCQGPEAAMSAPAMPAMSALNVDYKNSAHYYLSDNEEKNEFCCYDENGRFYDVNVIRMKIMEWNKDSKSNVLHEDDEEDYDTIQERKKRVERKEKKSNSNYKHMYENNKINSNNKKAIKILERVRNKKVRNKKDTGIDFGAFYLEKGVKIGLQRSNSCASFLNHRDKCIEKVQNRESASGNSCASSNVNRKVAVFHNFHVKKRKRSNNDSNYNNGNASKKRRLC